jgi:hypothetical protein
MQTETPLLLDAERIRDQLSAAEELAYMGHDGPAVVAAGAALEGALRLSSEHLADAPVALVLAELRVADVLDATELDLASDLIDARDHLIHGWQPDGRQLDIGRGLGVAFSLTARLLEPSDPVARCATG